MVECRSVSIEELKKNNPRFCLSALRVFGKCDECEVMQRYYKDKTGKVKPCESAVFSKERLEYLKEKERVGKEIKELESKLKKLKEKENGI